MPRKNYPPALIDATAQLWRSLEHTGEHRRMGTKKHMARILTNLGLLGGAVGTKDVNNMLDKLQEAGIVGDHHVIGHKGASSTEVKHGHSLYAALEKERIISAVNAPKTPRERTITGGIYRIAMMPDAHASVPLSNDRFTWFGRMAADKKVDCIGSIGDFGSWDSVSSHERPGTVKFSMKPSFDMEFMVVKDAIERISAELPKKNKIKKFMTMGNHEARIYFYEDQNPATYGMMTGKWEQLLDSHGWEHYPYGQEVFVEGVSFTHKPFNVMGKPKSDAAIRRDLTYDMYTGHNHNKKDEQVPKQGGHVNYISGGVFLPDGYLPAYAKFAQTGWWYGCQILTIFDGRIEGVEWINMKRLERDYGG